MITFTLYVSNTYSMTLIFYPAIDNFFNKLCQVKRIQVPRRFVLFLIKGVNTKVKTYLICVKNCIEKYF